MYAIIKNGGKQYRVQEGAKVRLETFEAEVGQIVDFKEVLLISNGEEVQIGAPFVKDASVSVEVLEYGRGDKIRIIKLKRRKHHLKHQGHRQDFISVKVTAIKAAGMKALPAPEKTVKKAPVKKAVAKKTTVTKEASKPKAKKTTKAEK